MDKGYYLHWTGCGRWSISGPCEEAPGRGNSYSKWTQEDLQLQGRLWDSSCLQHRLSTGKMIHQEEHRNTNAHVSLFSTTAKGRKHFHEFRWRRSLHANTMVGSDLPTFLQACNLYVGTVTLNLNCLIFLSQQPRIFCLWRINIYKP